MKLSDKILKFLYKDSKPNFDKYYLADDLAKKLKVDEKQIYPALRHLNNLGHISAQNKPGWVGHLDIEDKQIALSSNGIKFLEEAKLRKIRIWGLIIISTSALIISIIALLKPTP